MRVQGAEYELVQRNKKMDKIVSRITGEIIGPAKTSIGTYCEGEVPSALYYRTITGLSQDLLASIKIFKDIFVQIHN